MSIESLIEQLGGLSALPQHAGLANTAGLVAAKAAHGAAQNQANALNQSLQGAAQAYAQQLQHGQMMGGIHTFGQGAVGQGVLGQLGQPWTYDPKSQRIGQMKAALELMNPTALEKYQPVIQLMGIHMVAPPILVQTALPTTAHWQMEIEVNGKWIRHYWQSETADGGDLPEWDANLGYLLDRVARIKRRGMEGEAVAPECNVAGDQV